MTRPFQPRLVLPSICISAHRSCADAETGRAAFGKLEVPNFHRTG